MATTANNCSSKKKNKKLSRREKNRKRLSERDSVQESKSQSHVHRQGQIVTQVDNVCNEMEENYLCDESGSDYNDRDGAEIDQANTNVPGRKHLEQIRKSLGLTEADFLAHKTKTKEQNQQERKLHCVPNKYGVKKRPPPEVVVFTGHKKKKKDDFKADTSGACMDLNSAKWDVRRFGTSGLSGSDKSASTLDMLIRLGAKAPKPKAKNYKEILENKRLEKLEREQLLLERQKYGDTGKIGEDKLKKKKRNRKKKDRNAVGGSFGVLGKERHGTQIISRRDIRRITKTKSRR